MTMRIAAAGMLLAMLTAAPALLGGSQRWVLSQPRIQATGIGYCNKVAQLYRTNPDTPVPPGCANRGAFKGLLPRTGDGPAPDAPMPAAP